MRNDASAAIEALCRMPGEDALDAGITAFADFAAEERFRDADEVADFLFRARDRFLAEQGGWPDGSEGEGV